MESVRDYLSRKHKEIVEGYEQTRDYEKIRCEDVANEAAMRLLARGRVPDVISFRLKPWPRLFRKPKPRKLYPKMFEGRIWWMHHYACRWNELIYCPFMGEPSPSNEYTNEMFGKKITPLVIVGQEEIENHIQRCIRRVNAM